MTRSKAGSLCCSSLPGSWSSSGPQDLDDKEQGRKLMLQFATRLMELKRSTRPDGKAFLSKRTQFQIQDVLDLRANNWQKKTLKETAKKMSDIRNDGMAETKQSTRR